MNNWDELEKAAKSALECGPQVGGYDWNPSSWMNRNEFAYAVKAHPKTVLALIEQNRELLEALKTCLAYGATGPYKWVINQAQEAIRKATGEEA